MTPAKVVFNVFVVHILLTCHNFWLHIHFKEYDQKMGISYRKTFYTTAINSMSHGISNRVFMEELSSCINLLNLNYIESILPNSSTPLKIYLDRHWKH